MILNKKKTFIPPKYIKFDKNHIFKKGDTVNVLFKSINIEDDFEISHVNWKILYLIYEKNDAYEKILYEGNKIHQNYARKKIYI